MSKRRLSEALAARSPLARREAGEPVGRPAEGRPGGGTDGPVVAAKVASHPPDGLDGAEGAVATRGGQDVDLVVQLDAQPAGTALPAYGTPESPGGQSWQGQAPLERWVDAQWELWDAWFALAEQSLSALTPGLPVGWGQPALRAWREATRQALDAQAAWLGRPPAQPRGH